MHDSTTAQRKSAIDVALRSAHADLVLINAKLLNVHTREILHSDIAIKDGRVAAVVPYGSIAWSTGEPVKDLGGRFVTPGFIDPHVHVESSMMTVSQFSRAVIPRGVTTIAADPHEMGNVLGMQGMRAMLDEAMSVPLRMLLRVPGRIPAMPTWLETSGGNLDVADTQEMLAWPEAVCLAGDINPVLILRQDPDQFAKADLAINRNMTVSGQSPGLTGLQLCAYVAAGPEDSHVALNVAEIIENQRMGLRSILTLREGRRLDRAQFHALADLIRARGIDTRYLQFCTDDMFPHLIEKDGHIDHRVRVAIEEGFGAETAIQMATINVAEGLRIDRDYGSITPGKHADLLVMSDLNEIAIDDVMIAGRWVALSGSYIAEASDYRYADWSRQTMRIDREIDPEELRIETPKDAVAAEIRALHTSTPKTEKLFKLRIVNGNIEPDPEQGVSAMAVLDRHSGSKNIGLGFVSGFHVKRGAIASTVSHDAHNLRVIGANYQDMAVAVNRAVAIGGGYVVALGGKVVVEAPLPIAGLMSERPYEEVAEMARCVERTLVDVLGCPPIVEILLQLTHLSLPNIPLFGFTDFGLISTNQMKIVPSVSSFLDAAGVATAPPQGSYGSFRKKTLALARRCGCSL